MSLFFSDNDFGVFAGKDGDGQFGSGYFLLSEKAEYWLDKLGLLSAMENLGNETVFGGRNNKGDRKKMVFVCGKQPGDKPPPAAPAPPAGKTFPGYALDNFNIGGYRPGFDDTFVKADFIRRAEAAHRPTPLARHENTPVYVN